MSTIRRCASVLISCSAFLLIWLPAVAAADENPGESQQQEATESIQPVLLTQTTGTRERRPEDSDSGSRSFTVLKGEGKKRKESRTRQTSPSRQRLDGASKQSIDIQPAQDPDSSSRDTTETSQPGTEAANESDSIVAMARDIQERLKQIDAATDLEEALKAELTKRYRQALESLKLANNASIRLRKYQEEAKAAPQRIAQLKQQLDDPAKAGEADFPSGVTLPELEQLLTVAETELAAAKQELEKVDSEAKSRQARKAKLPQLTESVEKQQIEIEEALAAAAPEGEPALLTQAKRVEWESRQKLLEIQIPLQKAELLWATARSEAFTLERDIAQRQASAAEKRASLLKERVTQFRKSEAERKAREARREVAYAHPALKELAESNAELAETRVKLSRSIERTAATLNRIAERLSTLKEQYKDVQEKEDAAGLTTAVGMVLRRQREELPDLAPLYDRLEKVEAELPRSELEKMALQSERTKLADVDAHFETIWTSLEVSQDQKNSAEVKQTLRDLLQSKRTYLDELLKDYGTYLGQLTNLDIETRNLIAKTEEYGNYIDERVLWVRSTDMLASNDVSRAWVAIHHFADWSSWSGLMAGIVEVSRTRPIETSIATLICLIVLLYGHQIRRRLRQLGEMDEDDEAGGFVPTAKALFLTIVGASLWPLLMGFAAWRLAALEGTTLFAQAVAEGLRMAAIVYWTIGVVRQVCRPNGVAHVHFHWTGRAVRILHSNLTWLLLLWLPITFLVVLIDAHNVDDWSNSLGRGLFVIGMTALSIFFARVLRRGSGVLDKVTGSERYGWLNRLRWVWYPLTVGTPAILALLAVWGYYYTAEQLAGRLLATIWLTIGLVVAEALFSRWFVQLRDRMERGQETQRRIQAAVEADADGGEVPQHFFADFDIANINREIHRLLHGGVFAGLLLGGWLIWANVLPALGILDRVELWSNTVQVTQQVEAAGGETVVQTVDKVEPTTLAHVLISLALLWGTIFAARNLPGLIEVVLLQRLPLDQGGRHAVSTICRYVLTLVGVAFSCRMVGITWSSVQWLVAAMTVGLGFGLQEIFANFVSGLILLIERPLRVGDLVTVGSVTGYVSKMHIRATTVADFDRRELVVPNKKFITDEFVNWTLSDPITRVVLPVGIAYGSETNHAYELLLKVARENALVLDDPAPTALFAGFGDSTLDFELRVFIGRRDTYNIVVHELNMAIDREFAKANIEIAFPQRDINVRSVEGLAQLLPAAFNASETRKDAA